MISRTRIGVVAAAVAIGAMGQIGTGQQRPGNTPAKPNFDIRSGRAPAAPSARAADEIGRRRTARGASAPRLNPHTGALRVLDAPDVSVPPDATPPELLAALRDLAPRLGLDDDDLSAMEMVRDYVSASTRLRHVTFAQGFDGLPVFDAVVTLHIATSGAGAGSIVRINSSAARGAGRSRRNAAVSADAAVVAAAADVSPGAPFVAVRLDAGNAPIVRFARGRFPREVVSSLTWFPMDGGLRLAWHVELETEALSQFYDLLVDASSGELLLRHNRVLDALGSGRVIQSDATRALDPRRPDAMPGGPGACPPPSNHITRDLTAPFRDPGTVLFDTGRLSGNNTRVFLNSPGTEGAIGTFDGTRWIFDAPFGSAASAETTLFFSLNFMHDFFYDLGFNEAAGNFQADNFGRGGLGGDAIAGVARAAGRNNATFLPQPEGTSPIISMFLWDGAGCWAQDVDGDGATDIDGDFDSDIVYHEFHHGVTMRLNRQFTGSEAGAIGEGGGDFFAYSINGDTSLAEYSWPGGIRTVNGKTYASWFCVFGFICEVHTNGEIWANVLWDARERFRTDLAGGSEAAAINEIHQLYVDGLKLSPPAPTMLDLRDAMLLADAHRNPGSPNSQNYCRLWESFAGRGMGLNATDTAANPGNRVTPSAAVPAGCTAPPAAEFVSVAATTATAREAGLVNGVVTVSRADPLGTPLTVNLTVTGTAVAGADYVALPASVTIPADARSVVVPIAPLDDAAVEPNESVVVTLAAGGYLAGSPASATVTIVSDDLAPDFIISSFTAPDIAAAGQSITVTDTTRNQGGSGAASTTSFYLSANYALDAADPLLGTREVPALAAGATHTATTTLALPAPLDAAVYYVIAKADGPGLLAETSDLNNVRNEAISIGADLVVSALTVPINGGAGVQISVVETTKNQGTGATAASTTRFYLSTNFALDAADPFLAARAVPALTPGESSAATTSMTIPSNTTTGTYYVLAIADADNEIPETSNTNNTRTGSVRVGPDLTFTALTAPTRAAVGAAITIGDTTANTGGGPAGAGSRTAFYLSPNLTVDAGDFALGVREIPALGPGTSSAGTTSIALPAGAGPGRWYLIARCDDLAQVAETLETNNIRTTTIDIGPDLTLWSLTAPNTVAAGASLTITDSVLNYGVQTAPPSTNRYYLSLNQTLDASDILLDGQRAVAALAYNATNAGSATVQIPAGLSGAYYLLAVADGTAVVAEASETNNVRARALTITP